MQAAIDERNPRMISALLSLFPQTLQVTFVYNQSVLIYAVKKVLETDLNKEELE